ncbi:NAD-dependent succinate-semialdehyde dehydrogenase [Cupriavidus sp. YAF13]|uniref:NAD-dependent succinate-semialdehyde dehydrogenase n=1 Tax=Cupriavidus sp. YAF13 TaxID=3233075 RepID=UPI003F91B308
MDAMTKDRAAAGVPMLIAGEWVRGEAGGFVLTDPASGNVFNEFAGASGAQVDRAAAAAAGAFAGWKSRSAQDRAVILRTAADLLRAQAESLAVTLTREQGKPLAEARAEWRGAIEVLAWYAEEGLRAYGRIVPARASGLSQMVTREPIGPVAAFAPWNFPALTPMRKIAGALAAGCTCVIKPAEETPLSTLAIARALQDAGLPDGVLNVVCGDAPAIASRLLASPAIRKMSFTGSTAVGRLLAAQAAQRNIPATLELGGQAPVLVFADADLDLAVAQAGSAKFRNAGQVCTAPTRFLVEAPAYEAFVLRLSAYAHGLRVGAGSDGATQMGPLANARRAAQLQALVDDALAQGAEVCPAGSLPAGDGFYFAPTVLHGVGGTTARILQEEPFGPVAACQRFASFDEAITLANSVPFGLASYVFTRSLKTAHRAAQALEAGMVGVNTARVAVAETPFGGVKDSGYGSEGGSEGLGAYLQTKSVSLAFD